VVSRLGSFNQAKERSNYEDEEGAKTLYSFIVNINNKGKEQT